MCNFIHSFFNKIKQINLYFMHTFSTNLYKFSLQMLLKYLVILKFVNGPLVPYCNVCNKLNAKNIRTKSDDEESPYRQFHCGISSEKCADQHLTDKSVVPFLQDSFRILWTRTDRYPRSQFEYVRGMSDAMGICSCFPILFLSPDCLE